MIGSSALLVLIYTVLLDYYFSEGIKVRTKATLERVAMDYAKKYANDPQTPLPEGPGISSYRSVDEMPTALRTLFSPDTYKHRHLQWCLETDADESEDHPLNQLTELCDGMPCKLIFLYTHRLNKTDWLYISQGLVMTQEEEWEHDVMEAITICIALIVLLGFSSLTLLLMRKIGRPVQQLANWVNSLAPSRLEQATPDFQFQELNLIANRLRDAFENLLQGMEKERRFLRHASHELRTPIAVLSGNLELLDRLAAREEHSEAEKQAIDRLKHAATDMQQLTETLLWLNRETEAPPVSKKLELADLVGTLIEDNRYLLEGRQVEVEVRGERGAVEVPPTPCLIVLTNLLRNAFQYTYHGRIIITVAETHLSVDNYNIGEPPHTSAESEVDYGFGLGLKLVGQIASRLNWQYQYEIRENGYTTIVHFRSQGTGECTEHRGGCTEP